MNNTTIEQIDISASISQLSDQLQLTFKDEKPLLVGIHKGGVWVAEALKENLAPDFFDGPLGTLNIAYYRDDYTRIGLHPEVNPSHLPFAIDDRDIILVDDIIHSGRTIRAALNEIFDYGRPASVTLVVLIARCGRELPIEPNFVGHTLELSEHQYVKLTNHNGLELELTRNRENRGNREQ